MDSVEKRAVTWAAGDNTGTSSKAILATMMGKPPKTRFCYPHDSSDFGRCVGLLDAVPEFRARMGEMRAIAPEWAALVDHWQELEAMYRSKDSWGRLYERMKAILDPIEKENPNYVKIGKNGGLYFGR